MTEGGAVRRRRKVTKPRVSKSHVSKSKVTKHKRVHKTGVKKRASTKVRKTTHRKSTGLGSKTVMQLRKLAKSKGIRQSHKGVPYKKSSLVRVLLTNPTIRRIHQRK